MEALSTEQIWRPHAVMQSLSTAVWSRLFLEQSTVLQVLDSLITSLTKHTSLLNPAVPQAAIAFGADELSCLATETMFELANRSGPAPNALRHALLVSQAFNVHFPETCAHQDMCC